MAWAAGTFTRVGGAIAWADDRDAAVELEAGLHDTHDEDLADGINSCLEKSGSNAMTGDLNFGTKKGINLGTPTASTDAATKAYADSVGLALASLDELLVRLATHTVIPTGFTISTVDNKAVKITGNEAASADGGTISFDAALVSAHATVIATEAAHTHAVSIASGGPSATESLPPRIGSPPGDTRVTNSHTHAVVGTSGVGSAHRHSITLAVQHRDFHIIIKT